MTNITLVCSLFFFVFISNIIVTRIESNILNELKELSTKIKNVSKNVNSIENIGIYDEETVNKIYSLEKELNIYKKQNIVIENRYKNFQKINILINVFIIFISVTLLIYSILSK